MKKSILQGLKVLDLSRILAGPYCTQILSDQGAEIIKVESPEGDETRRWGPPFRNDESAYFFGINRNKKSIVLDLRNPSCVKALSALIARADVVVENFKPGDLKKFGILQTLKNHARLIHCQISGFGQSGDFSEFVGYDAAIQAWSGLMSINGSKGPTKVGVPIIDLVTGQNAAFAIMAALYERERSGLGKKIETSLIENAFSILHPQVSNYFFSKRVPSLMGNTHPNIAPYDYYETKKKGIYIACGNDRQFRALCETLGAIEISDRSEFLTNSLRVKNRSLLEKKLKPLFKKSDAKTLAKKLLKNGVPCGPALDIQETLREPYVRDLKLVQSGEFVRAPYRFSRSRAVKATRPPILGSHTKEILKTLDLSGDEIKSILSRRVK